MKLRNEVAESGLKQTDRLNHFCSITAPQTDYGACRQLAPDQKGAVMCRRVVYVLTRQTCRWNTFAGYLLGAQAAQQHAGVASKVTGSCEHVESVFR